MEEKRVSPAVGSMVRICIDRYEADDWIGRIYTRYREEPILFEDATQLVESLESFYDWLNYPQPSVRERSFQKESGGKAGPEKGEREVIVSEENLNKKHGEQATFIVRIMFRQNATWQGQVTWAERNRTLPFRSALELLKLMDTAEDGGMGEKNWESK